MQDPRKVRHLLVTASYEADELVLSHLIRNSIEKVIQASHAEPVNITVYTTTVCFPVNQLSLTDAWQQLTDEERLYIYENMPRLFTAIFLAIKGTTPPTKQCEVTSKNGTACDVTGPHTVHVSKTGNNSLVSSEVWM